MKKLLSVAETLEILSVTHATLRDWERKRVLIPERNQFGWRMYSLDRVRKVESRIIKGRRDGKKLLLPLKAN